MPVTEAAAFFLAVLAYLWWLAMPLPWSGVLVLVAVALSWRRRSLTPKSLGLGWQEFRASGRRWGAVWICSVSLFLILGHRSLADPAALTHFAACFAWAAAQQVVYQSMTCLPLRDSLKSRGLAAGLAGAAFSILHIPNPVLVPATFVWGVASSLLFERCRTVWGLALLQTMLSAALFWVTPRELNRDFRIGPYYYEALPRKSPAGPLVRSSRSCVKPAASESVRKRAGTADGRGSVT
ncbi:MAG: hypothetical protein HY822_16650 [Acidobacteria bacterium]|nr:hypothetical protein [Acidobacteriota bacterium]